MNRKEFLLAHRELCEKLVRTTANKNDDYTGNSDDPFANLALVEHFRVATTEQGLFTRLCDKFSRLGSLIASTVVGNPVGPKVKDETVQDTLLDLANYALILAVYLDAAKQQAVDDGVVSSSFSSAEGTTIRVGMGG